MIKISIIVPIYNVEKYLRKCLDSLVNQTLKAIEIILVNDASPDRCDVIMEEYRSRYPEIIKCIYLTTNLRQGGARNKGLDVARGEYITFVDSDDYIDLTLCEKLYQKALLTGSDIVGCDYYYLKETTGEKRWISFYFKQQTGELNKSKISSLMFMFPGPVAKLIRKSMIIENQLYFPSQIRYEDFAIIPLYFTCAKRMEIVREPLYYYVIREQSTRHIADLGVQLEYLKSAEVLKDNFLRRGLSAYEEEVKGLYMKQIFMLLNKILTLFDDFNIDIIKDVEKLVKSLYPECKKNYYYTELDIVGRKIAELLNNNKIDELENEYLDGVLDTKDVNYIDYYKSQAEKIDNIFEYCRNNSYRVALWGAGLKGNDFLEVCDKDKKEIRFVIDKDPKKHGTSTKSGRPIVSFSQVFQNVNFIIIVNKNYYNANMYEIKEVNSDIKTFNLDLYLLMKDSKVENFIE